MGLLIDGFVPPPRAELGQNDKTKWELDSKGKQRDPWQEGLYLPMVTVDGRLVYTFTSSSDGGRRYGVGPLCGEYGHRIRQHPDELPVVRLEQNSYCTPTAASGGSNIRCSRLIAGLRPGRYLAAAAAVAGRPLGLLPGKAA